MSRRVNRELSVQAVHDRAASSADLAAHHTNVCEQPPDEPPDDGGKILPRPLYG